MLVLIIDVCYCICLMVVDCVVFGWLFGVLNVFGFGWNVLDVFGMVGVFLFLFWVVGDCSSVVVV